MVENFTIFGELTTFVAIVNAMATNPVYDHKASIQDKHSYFTVVLHWQ